MQLIFSAIIIGALAALLGSLLGVGGGIIMVPAFKGFLGLSMKQAIATALAVQSMFWVYGIFIFLGMAQGAFFPSAMSIVFDFAGEKGDNKMIMALIDTILSPFILMAIIVGGILSETVGFIILFRILGVLMFAGLLTIIFFVREPHHESSISVNS